MFAVTAGGAPNLYGLTDHGQAAYQNTAGKTTASTPSTTGLGSFIALGQSQISNAGVTLYTPSSAANVLNLNPYDGVIYRLADPALGTTGTTGSYLGRLGDKLIAAGKYTNILIEPIAMGGTTIGQWTSSGEPTASPVYWYSHRLITALNRFRQISITPTCILVEIGTQDAANGTSSANWQARFNDLVTTAQGVGYTGKWMVSLSTLVAGVSNATIRAAQAAVVNGTTILAGPDLDSLTGANLQGDGVHRTDTGNDNSAILWKNSIVASL